MGFFKKLFGQDNQSTYPKTPDELRLKIESVFYQLHTQHGDIIKNNSYGALAQKQRVHFGGEYITQLEKNIIYLNVLTQNFKVATASHLRTGRPVTSQNFEDFIQKNCVLPALEETQYHMDFLHHGCRGCRVHSNHDRYQYLKDFRRSCAETEYISELELRYVLGKASQQLSEFLFDVTLRNNEFAGLGRMLCAQEILEVIENRLGIHSRLVLGWYESS